MNPKVFSKISLVKERALHFSELVKDRFFFATLTDVNVKYFLKKSTDHRLCFVCVDSELTYQSFNHDFGPLNIGMLYQYCTKINSLFQKKSTVVVHLTSSNKEKRVNSAFLAGSYCIIYCKHLPNSVLYHLKDSSISYLAYKSFAPFVHAGFNYCDYLLYLEDCFEAIYKAVEAKLLNFDQFSLHEYQYYEKVENGDFNWIVPNKILAFCDPQTYSKSNLNYFQVYLKYFSEHNVSTVVRLNESQYDREIFTAKGIEHHDLIFTDGGTPSEHILRRFLHICETAPGSVAVHCKAGLGRTGTLIAAFLMRNFHFTAMEAIAWVRICRPGSIVGSQQKWLEKNQAFLWSKPESNNNNNKFEADSDPSLEVTVVKCQILAAAPESRGIAMTIASANHESSIAKLPIKLNTTEDGNCLTQGDLLNRIKLFRRTENSSSSPSSTTNTLISASSAGTTKHKNQLTYNSWKANKHDTRFKNNTFTTSDSTTTTTDTNNNRVSDGKQDTRGDDSLRLFGRKMIKYPSVISKVLPH